ncbi:hypothetical protein LC560_05240 [Fusobacterium animalis]|uniref:hypothetical protein n=1 Tax=Fusobacterium animalis TaxID=76859 RepID=UPI0030CE2454
MANYVLTLALKTELWQEHILEKRLNIARMIYNSCLSEILKRHRKMINSSEYKEISNLDKKEQSKRYKELDKKYSISKFELNKYVKPMTQRFKKNIGSQMGQELAERAFATIDTFKVKSSQLNHSTNEYEKKSLSKRWVEILGNKIQRDLYSAFLIKNVKENLEEVNIEKAQKEFKNFVKLHNEEIERIKKGNVKTLKCMGF